MSTFVACNLCIGHSRAKQCHVIRAEDCHMIHKIDCRDRVHCKRCSKEFSTMRFINFTAKVVQLNESCFTLHSPHPSPNYCISCTGVSWPESSLRLIKVRLKILVEYFKCKSFQAQWKTPGNMLEGSGSSELVSACKRLTE